MRTATLPRILALGLLAFTASCGPKVGKPGESVHLRYASPYPPNHPFSRADIAWIKKVEADSAGRLKIDTFWGGATISSDQTAFEVRHGVADVALVMPIYQRAGVQTVKVQTGFYTGADTPAEQVAVYHCLQRAFPRLDEEMAGQRVLAVQGGSLSHIVTRNRPVRTLADLRGLRLRAPVEAAPVLRRLGADPVTMPMGEVYSAMSKGSIDGVIAPWDTLKTLHFSEVARYVNNLKFARGGYPARSISLQAYRALPPDLQAVLDRDGRYWEEQLANEVNRAETDGLAFGRKQRVNFIDPSPADQTRLQEVENDVALEDAAKLDRYGVPGRDIFRATQTFIAAIKRGEPACPAS
ncbi:MAG: TRAP transporter substrate-binding protein DctP [Caulobacteraceae bacterium]